MDLSVFVVTFSGSKTAVGIDPMREVRMRLIYLFLLIALFPIKTNAELYSCTESNLSFSEILTKNKCDSEGKCIALSKIYEYSDYLEKEDRELYVDLGNCINLNKINIDSISIEDLPPLGNNLLVYSVTVNIDNNISNKLRGYFEERSRSSFAVLIDNSVFTLAQIVRIDGNRFHLTVYGRTKEQIKDQLSGISKNIDIKEGIPGIDY